MPAIGYKNVEQFKIAGKPRGGICAVCKANGARMSSQLELSLIGHRSKIGVRHRLQGLTCSRRE